MSAEKMELLKRALIEARENEFEEEKLNSEHEFSEEFDEKINAIISRRKKKQFVKYVYGFAAGFVLLFIVGGGSLIGINYMDMLIGSMDSSKEEYFINSDNGFEKNEASEDIIEAEDAYTEDISSDCDDISDVICEFTCDDEKVLVSFEFLEGIYDEIVSYAYIGDIPDADETGERILPKISGNVLSYNISRDEFINGEYLIVYLERDGLGLRRSFRIGEE